MKFDFSKYPISSQGYSKRPMAFLDIVPGKILGGIAELALIETGDRAAREQWQQVQLRNLLAHAAQRSAFWRNRLGSKLSDAKLGALPILTRTDLKRQVEEEGSLLRPTDGLETSTHGTSGSSGTPVEFYVTLMNVRYNSVRYLAQEFMDGRDLSVNRTRFTTARAADVEKLAKIPAGFIVNKEPSWLGDLASVFASGNFKRIVTIHPNPRDLVRELRKDAVGQLVAAPGILGAIVDHSGARLLRELRVSEFVPFGEAMDPALHKAIVDEGIPIRGTYTCEEVGPIGFECEAAPGHFHVATTNVIVEVEGWHEVDEKKLGRVLVTHLHSYATPFIRYDLGDLGLLGESCPCGHRGPTIHNLYGRVTNALKHRDGRFSRFYIRGDELMKLVRLAEFRIRQIGFESITIEIGGRESLTPKEIADVTSHIKDRAGNEFSIDVIPRPTIDWGHSFKRQSFRCEV